MKIIIEKEYIFNLWKITFFPHLGNNPIVFPGKQSLAKVFPPFIFILNNRWSSSMIACTYEYISLNE